MSEAKYFYVLYNDCYGGFGISNDAKIEYNRRANERGAPPEQRFVLYGASRPGFYADHYDPILIEMYLDKEWNIDGTRMDTKHSEIKIAQFDIKYEGCIKIAEYDGMETPYVDMGAFLKRGARRILYDDSLDDSAKVALLKEIIPNTLYNDNCLEREP